MANGWKFKNEKGCPLYFTYDGSEEGYVFLLFYDVPSYSTERILKAISFEDKV